MPRIKASRGDRIRLDDLMKIVEIEEHSITVASRTGIKRISKYEYIQQQYLEKVSKKHIEKAIVRALVNNKKECIIIDDYYWEDDCQRYHVFYNMDVYDELLKLIPEDTRIITNHTC